MSRSQLILPMMLIASVLVASAQHSNSDRYFDDFRGQRFCATRYTGSHGKCCSSRIDECSVPIAGKILLTNFPFKFQEFLMKY